MKQQHLTTNNNTNDTNDNDNNDTKQQPTTNNQLQTESNTAASRFRRCRYACHPSRHDDGRPAARAAQCSVIAGPSADNDDGQQPPQPIAVALSNKQQQQQQQQQ
jgi:hypothetical protein